MTDKEPTKCELCEGRDICCCGCGPCEKNKKSGECSCPHPYQSMLPESMPKPTNPDGGMTREITEILKKHTYVPGEFRDDYLRSSSYRWHGDRPPGYFIQTYVGVDQTIEAIVKLLQAEREKQEPSFKDPALNILEKNNFKRKIELELQAEKEKVRLAVEVLEVIEKDEDQSEFWLMAHETLAKIKGEG